MSDKDDFEFKTGDVLILKGPLEHRIAPHEAVVGLLGIGPDDALAYQLYFNKSKFSGKFFPKDEVEGQFELKT